MMLRPIQISVLLTACLLPGKAQILTLDSIFTAIEKYNPQLKVFEERIKVLDEYAIGARAIDAPQVGAGFFMTPYNSQMWRPKEMNNEMGSLMISAQQMFMNPKKLSSNAQYMKRMPEVEKQMLKAMRNELFSMAKMNYYESVILKKKLAALEESEDILNYLIKSTELRYTYGMDNINAYYKAKAMAGDLAVMKLTALKEYEQRTIFLNTLMNNKKDSRFDIDTAFTIKNYERMKEDTAQIQALSSDYKVLEENINLLKSKQTMERSRGLPDFGVKYDHMLPFGKQPQQFSLMVMVTIPFAPWSAKMYKSQVHGVNHELQSLRFQQQNFTNEITGRLESIKVQIKTKKQQLELYEKTILVSMQKNYESASLAYKQNTEELFMVLDAWQNLQLVQLSYLDELMELAKLQVEYERELEIK